MLPSFSIVIPTYARPEPLKTCLQSLARLDYPRDRFEVIVVDDGSPSAPQNLVDSFRDGLEVTLLHQPHAGPATARNAGAARAAGEFLAFTDDDCSPTADWLKALADRFAATPDAVLGGRTLNGLRGNLYSATSQLFVDYLYEYYTHGDNVPRFFTSNNLAVPAKGFQEVGGFDSSFPLAGGEDRDFCDRWQHHGRRLVYAPEALICHAHALTFRTFVRQHFQYGRGAFRFHEVRAQRTNQRLRLEPPSFYARLVWYPSTKKNGWRRWAAVVLLALSQVANAAGYFREGADRAKETQERLA